MNPSTSTEVTIRSDILHDLECPTERNLRLEEETRVRKEQEKKILPNELVGRDDFQAAVDVNAGISKFA